MNPSSDLSAQLWFDKDDDDDDDDVLFAPVSPLRFITRTYSYFNILVGPFYLLNIRSKPDSSLTELLAGYLIKQNLSSQIPS